jgi:hypothetical protein
LKQCPTAGSLSGCRADYVCDVGGTTGTLVPVCFPACVTAFTCPTTNLCDARGFCCGNPGLECCDNSTCSTGTCVSGFCK